MKSLTSHVLTAILVSFLSFNLGMIVAKAVFNTNKEPKTYYPKSNPEIECLVYEGIVCYPKYYIGQPNNREESSI